MIFGFSNLKLSIKFTGSDMKSYDCMLDKLMICFLLSDSQVVAVAVERFLTVRFPFHKVFRMIFQCISLYKFVSEFVFALGHNRCASFSFHKVFRMLCPCYTFCNVLNNRC